MKMDMKYLLLMIGLVLLVGTASAEGEPTNVNMDIPYNKTLLDTPMWFNATADGATSWLWDFGDGTNSTAQNVSKSFTAEGDYFVTLTATNEFGDTTIGREVQARRNVFASDGKTWTQATASAGWSGRYSHTSVVYDGKMWVMGGHGGGRDVWWSTNGITWTQATASAGWSARYAHTSVVYDGKMWVMGGYDGSYKRDVWWSTDGITWTQATASAGWSTRDRHTSVVYDGKMWVMGGYDKSNKRDVWCTTIGEPIVQPAPPLMTGTAIPFSTPLDYYNHTSYLWDFGDGQTATGTNPSHTYATAGTYTVTLTMPDEVNGIQTVYTEEITIGESPTAAFTANTTAGLTPLTVQFTDESTGNPTSWSWTFGDGQTATIKNPVHTYTTAGTYSVNLTVTNAYGTDSLVKSDYITVQSLATVAFTANQTSVYAYDPIQFTDQSTGDNITAWNWSFGDNTTSDDQNPVHTYTADGTYDVTLNVTNPAGTATLTKSNYISVVPVPPPTVQFTANQTTVYPNETILFTDQSTNDRFPIQSWNWSFGDDTWVNQTVNEPVTHAYAEPGSYTVELFVTGYGGTASKTTTITVNAIPVPTVAFTANKSTVYPNETILFTDQTVSQFPMTAWNWSFGDGQWINQTTSGPVEHAYTAPGTYTVTLYVTGEGGVGSKTSQITVEPFPVPVVDFTANVTEEVRPMTVQFTDLSTYEPYQWYWDFGDGYDSTEQNPVHTYKYEGTYAVTLTAWNVNGQNSTTKTGYITVNLPQLPTLRDLHIQNNGVTVTDYQVSYEVKNDDEFFGLLQSNPAHLEVYNGAGDQSYYFWIESFNTMTNSSKIWIKIPTLTGGGAITPVRLKYNDNRDIPLSDGDHTFLLFDAFDTIGINDEEWTVGGTPTQSEGSLWLAAGDSLVSTPQYPYHSIAIDARVRTGGSDLDLALSTAGTNWKSAGDGFGLTVNGDLTARAINDGSVTTETVPIAADANYHTYTIYEIDSNLVYQRDGITQKVIGTNQPDTNLNAVLQGDGEVDWIFVRKFSTQDYVYLVPPQAAFTADIVKGVAPLTVNFTDTSLNSPTAWAWDFGDDQTSTEQHPTHTFTEVGNYTVTLTATNLRGSDEYSTIISATKPFPVANFTQNVTAGDEPLTVQFTDTSLNEPNQWFWQFGDGQTSTEQHPVHTYVDGGKYQVSLTVSSFAGTDTLTVPEAVTVGNVYVEPVAAFAASATTVDKGSAIKFTDQSTNEPLSWSWQFGDGQTSTSQNPTHTYTTPGTYAVTLTVTNPAGSNTTTETITVLERMPVAAFSGTPRAGDHPLTVQFTDQTSNNPTQWSWDFGDGSTSTEQNPTHTYTAAGAYTVTLTATNARGTDDEVKPEYIRVDVPDVAFTANVTSGNRPLTVQFTDESTKQPTAWLWNFGDGQTSTEQNPVHTYTTAGMKTVTLTATNANGAASLTKSGYITVVELAPVAAFSAPAAVDRYQYAHFTDSSSNNPTKWEWSFGDGATYTTTDYRYKNPNHQYTAPGTYTVTLRVTNAIGTDTTTRTVVVNQIPPNAAFTATNTVGDAPLTVQFTDQSSREPTAWSWDFGDGETSTVQHPTHTYTVPGTYSVTLTVTNAAGSAAVTKTDLVAVNTPAVAITVDPAVGEKPLTVHFTDESTNDPTAWLWKFGDGATSTEQHPTHTYTASGVYTVTLTATNAYGTTTKSFPAAVTVYELAPDAAFTANVTEGDKPLSVQFTDLSTNNPTRWFWSFGDGTTSTLRHPVHTYTAPGLYTVTLTATNPKGSDSVTRTNYITVEEIPPVAAFTVDHTYMIAGQDIQFTDQSQNSPTTWFWQFGDGTTSSLKNPRHAYAAPGTYTVTLRVTNEKGQSDLVKINYITVDTHLPIADFDCNPVMGAAPLTVTFTDESEFLPYQWYWQFGDGATSTVQHPTHTYREPGTYTVTLRASNAIGSDTMVKHDIITVQIPEMDFTATPTMGHTPLTTQFTVDGLANWDYLWSFGDGTTSTEQNPVHQYTTRAEQQYFTVTLTISYNGVQQVITKPDYIDVRTKSVEEFMEEQKANIVGVIAIGAILALIGWLVAIFWSKS